MNQFIESLHWLDRKHEVAYSMIRIFLGVALFVRGWLLISDPEAITHIATGDNMHAWYSYITIAHLAGGLLIAFGALTRLGALFQVPILFSAVVFVHAEKGLMMGGQSLELATLVLFLLVIFTLFGGGIYSIDRYFQQRKYRKSREEPPAG
ncbi:MAG: DoxX family protein [Saprospiraceae bacterium]